MAYETIFVGLLPAMLDGYPESLDTSIKILIIQLLPQRPSKFGA